MYNITYLYLHHKHMTKVKHPNIEDNKKISPELDHREIEGDLLGLKTTCNFIV